MYKDLAAFLFHDYQNLPRGQIFVICDRRLADGSFLLYHFISLFQRGQTGRTYLLALNNSLNHYQIVLSKLGVQVQRQIERGRFEILDFSKLLFTDYGHFFTNLNSDNGEEAMKNLYLKIKSDVEKIMSKKENEKTWPPLLFVVDCASVLLDFGVPLKYVVLFLRYCRNLAKHYEATFVILTKTDDEFASAVCEEKTLRAYDLLATELRDFDAKIGWILDVRTLATGWSKDISGEVLIRQVKTSDDTIQDLINELLETRLLYKLGDRNVTFTPPGLVPRIGV